MKTAAIIPIKRFSKAKTRLGLSKHKVSELCALMLEEILRITCTSPHIVQTVLVTGDSEAAKIGGRFDSTIIRDECDDGVNEAVALADRYLHKNGFDASIVLPQDIPYIKSQDIDFMMKFAAPPNFAVIVPSRRFDGTNALVRMPVDLMNTHYDDDSYREHIKIAKQHTRNASPIFVRRIMMDLDTKADLEFLLANVEKPSVAKRIADIVGT